MTLDEAIELAAFAHRGQLDKCGQPYILHPLRVMQAVGPDIEQMIVAVLHDTVEDTFVTEELLLDRGLPIHLVEAVFALTRQDGESYRQFIGRLAKNPIARAVKICDIEDNLAEGRQPRDEDLKTIIDRRAKYRRALAYLYAYSVLGEKAGQALL